MKKKTVKKTAAVKKIAAKKSLKKDIAEAVRNIPELVAGQVQLDETTPKNYEQPKSFESNTVLDRLPLAKKIPPYQPPKHSGLLLWLGVGIISLAVFVVWFFNIKTMVLDFGKNKSPEGEMWQSASTDLSGAFSTVTDGENDFTRQLDNLQKEITKESSASESATKEQIKQTLAAILANTVTTPTAEASASSTDSTETTVY